MNPKRTDTTVRATDHPRRSVKPPKIPYTSMKSSHRSKAKDTVDTIKEEGDTQQKLSHDTEDYHRNDLMFLKMEFLQAFQLCYRRNNKAGGVKNVRCFPQCSPVHSPQGFCGQPVIAKCVVIRKIDEMSVMNMTIVGEFQPLGREFNGIRSGIRDNEIMRQKQRRGFVHEEVELCFETKPWQYNWPANKHKVETMHSFFVNVLIPKSEFAHLSGNDRSGSPNSLLANASELVLVQRFQSPSFSIKSVRKSNSDRVLAQQCVDNFEHAMDIGHESSKHTFRAAATSGKRKRVPTVAEAVSTTDSSSASSDFIAYSTDSGESEDPTQLDLIEDDDSEDNILAHSASEDAVSPIGDEEEEEEPIKTDDIIEQLPEVEFEIIHPSLFSPARIVADNSTMPPMQRTFESDCEDPSHSYGNYPQTLDSQFFQRAMYCGLVASSSGGSGPNDDHLENFDTNNAKHKRMLHSLFPNIYAPN